jgi:hypothetical protein
MITLFVPVDPATATQLLESPTARELVWDRSVQPM